MSYCSSHTPTTTAAATGIFLLLRTNFSHRWCWCCFSVNGANILERIWRSYRWPRVGCPCWTIEPCWNGFRWYAAATSRGHTVLLTILHQLHVSFYILGLLLTSVLQSFPSRGFPRPSHNQTLAASNISPTADAPQTLKQKKRKKQIATQTVKSQSQFRRRKHNDRSHELPSFCNQMPYPRQSIKLSITKRKKKIVGNQTWFFKLLSRKHHRCTRSCYSIEKNSQNSKKSLVNKRRNRASCEGALCLLFSLSLSLAAAKLSVVPGRGLPPAACMQHRRQNQKEIIKIGKKKKFK